MSYRFLEIDQTHDGIVVITINDPDAKNAVNWEMNAEFVQELGRIERDPAARAVIITGSGAIFCSGGNIRRMAEQGKVLQAPDSTVLQLGHPHTSDIRAVTTGIRRLSKPTIAAVNGPCVGSGIGIAAGCDIRIASTASRFGWVFVRRGIVPDDGSLKLVLDIIGYAKAYKWGIVGGTLSAAEAADLEFVDEVVAPEVLLDRARARAREIIENCPPVTVQLFKLALVHALDADLDDSISFTHRAQEIARDTDDHTEALRAYAEKRAPVWQGR